MIQLNLEGIKLLREKDMVSDLQNIDYIKLCEGYVLRKQSTMFFPIDNTWRVILCLQLLHVD